MAAQPRCPNCGALVFPDAEWCSQCYEPLRPREHPAADEPAAPTADRPTAPSRPGASPRVGGTPAGAGGIAVEDGTPTWTCPVCEARNPIEASLCSVCGTPFDRLLQEPEVRPEIDPQTAAVWSMVLPGLGHWRLGRKADAVARFAVFGWAFGALLAILISRIGTGGLGPTLPLVALFVAASVGIYVISAVDAYRIAAGDQPVLGSRALLWASVGLIFASVLIATFVTFPAARR